MEFALFADDLAKVAAWSKEQDELVKKMQGTDRPNYGAIGGALTYSFTPTSMGSIIRVTHAVTKNVLDLTNYDAW